MFLKYIQKIYHTDDRDELEKIIELAREDLSRDEDKEDLLILERRVYYKLNK